MKAGYRNKNKSNPAAHENAFPVHFQWGPLWYSCSSFSHLSLQTSSFISLFPWAWSWCQFNFTGVCNQPRLPIKVSANTNTSDYTTPCCTMDPVIKRKNAQLAIMTMKVNVMNFHLNADRNELEESGRGKCFSSDDLTCNLGERGFQSTTNRKGQQVDIITISLKGPLISC